MFSITQKTLKQTLCPYHLPLTCYYDVAQARIYFSSAYMFYSTLEDLKKNS